MYYMQNGIKNVVEFNTLAFSGGGMKYNILILFAVAMICFILYKLYKLM